MKVFRIRIGELWGYEHEVYGRTEDEAQAQMVTNMNRWLKDPSTGFRCECGVCDTPEYNFHRRATRKHIENVVLYYGGQYGWVNVPSIVEF